MPPSKASSKAALGSSSKPKALDLKKKPAGVAGSVPSARATPRVSARKAPSKAKAKKAPTIRPVPEEAVEVVASPAAAAAPSPAQSVPSELEPVWPEAATPASAPTQSVPSELEPEAATLASAAPAEAGEPTALALSPAVAVQVPVTTAPAPAAGEELSAANELLHPESVEELTSLLTTAGVDLSHWGAGSAKTVEQLMSEITKHDSMLVRTRTGARFGASSSTWPSNCATKGASSWRLIRNSTAPRVNASCS